MITSATWGRRALFQNERRARLLIDTLYHYRGSYLLHAFIVMPDHIHVLLTPRMSLERAVQFIKGGFSYRGRKELGSNMEIWQKGFSDHRIRDAGDYREHVSYVHLNPVRKRLCASPAEYPYSSARGDFQLDPAPEGLKPSDLANSIGAPEGAPFQSGTADSAVRDVPSQSKAAGSAVQVMPLQSKKPRTAGQGTDHGEKLKKNAS